MRSSIAASLFAFLAVPFAWSQMAISVRSGLLHHVEGQAELDGTPVTPKPGEFPMVNPGSTLATRDGKAEILLAPGAFLRLAPNTSVNMLSSALSDTRVEVLHGTALVEVADLPKETSIAVRIANIDTYVKSRGLYEFDGNAARLRVFDGKAQINRPTPGDKPLTAKKGREVLLAAPKLETAKFNTKESQSTLYAWSENRSMRIAQTNLVAARSAQKSGLRLPSSGWAFYPSWGMYTFLPRSGLFASPFGWNWYSPGSIWQYGLYSPYYGYPGGYYGGYPRSNRNWEGLGSRRPSGGGSIGMGRGASSTGGGAPRAPMSGGRGRAR